MPGCDNTTTASTFGNQVWYAWTDTTTNVSVTTGSSDTTGSFQNVVWDSWNSTTTTGSSYTTSGQVVYWRSWASDADREAARRRREQAALKSRLERSPIRKRAAALLRRLLSDDQWRDYEQHESVRVVGSQGGLYEVGHNNWEGMLVKLDPQTEQPIEKLCCHPSASYPAEDRIATMVLALQTDEPSILAKANRHPWKQYERERVEKRRLFRTRAA